MFFNFSGKFGLGTLARVFFLACVFFLEVDGEVGVEVSAKTMSSEVGVEVGAKTMSSEVGSKESRVKKGSKGRSSSIAVSRSKMKLCEPFDCRRSIYSENILLISGIKSRFSTSTATSTEI